MSKLQQVILEQDALTRQSFIKEENRKAFTDAYANVNMPANGREEIADFFESTSLPRIGAVRFVSYKVASSDSDEGTIWGEKDMNSVFAKMVQKRNSFPLLLVYSPALSKMQDDNQKKTTLQRVICSRSISSEKITAMFPNDPDLERFLSDNNDIGKGEIPEDVLELLESGKLPAGLPDKIMVDGSQSRMIALAKNEGNVSFTHEGKCIAVLHERRYRNGACSTLWTFFVPKINPVIAFADRLTHEPTSLPLDIAVKIAISLCHDQYYMICDVSHDARSYSGNVAYHEGITCEDENMYDLLQGEVNVFCYNCRYYANINIDEPSAFLIKGRINVYVPA